MRPYQKTTDWRFQEYRISKRTEQINTVPIDIINRVSRIQQAGQTVSAPTPISLQSSININNQTILSQHKIFKFLREISCLFSNLKKCYNLLPDGFLLWNCPQMLQEAFCLFLTPPRKVPIKMTALNGGAVKIYGGRGADFVRFAVDKCPPEVIHCKQQIKHRQRR